jgi:hypothetical protein
VTRLPRFEPTLNGKDVFLCEVGDSGVTYSHELERMYAAHYWRKTPSEFEALDSEEQAKMLAVYRTNGQIAAAVEHQRYIEAISKMPPPKTRTGGRRLGKRR